jgi:hypothetical protein
MKFDVSKTDFRQVIITLLNNIYRPNEFEDITLGTAMDDIQTGVYAKQVRRVREIYQRHGKCPEYSKAKAKLPSFAFSGTFRDSVENANLAKHSGVMPLDIDRVHIPTVWGALTADEHIMFLFRSPSGDGIKGGIPITGNIKNDDDHKRAFFQVEQYLNDRHGIKIDPACKDVRRLCFISHDPDLYYNPNAKSIQIADAPPPPPPEKKPMGRATTAHIPDRLVRRKLEAACQRIVNAPDGEMHHTRLRIARLVGGWIAGGIIDHGTARDALEAAVTASETKNFKASMKTIDDGLKYGAETPIPPHELIDEYQRYIDRRQRERQAVKAFNDWTRRYKLKLCKALDRGELETHHIRHLKIMLNGSESDRFKVYREVSKNER